MARGIQPSAAQLAEERRITELAATAELVTWDRYERELLTYLERQITNPTLLAVVRRLQRGNAIEDADHVELYDAVRVTG
jgi:hypothetical protein